MSAQQVEEQYDDVAGGGGSSVGPVEPTGPVGPVTAPESAGPVEVRRNAAVGAGIGVAAAAVGIAYLWRAAGSGSPLDWAVCALMAALALVFLRSLFDARTPLLVIDELGVRMRLAHHWRGLPWEAIDTVVVKPRRGLLHDGRVVIGLHSPPRATEGLDRRARRQAALNSRLYGATLAVPLGLTTRVVGARADEVADRVAALSEGRADVVTLVGTAAAEPADHSAEPPLATDRVAPRGAEGPSDVEVTDEPLGDVEETVADIDLSAEPPLVTGRAAPDGGPRRVRWLRRSGRALQPDAAEAPYVEQAVPDAAGEDDEPGVELVGDTPANQPVALRRIGEVTTAMTSAVSGVVTEAVTKAVAPVADRDVTDSKVRAIARLGEPVAPLVIDDFRPEPAYDPVIGPELAAARTRVGLSVDELADRTRIRPHVIESIEVDDFGACGGDFYARGHIRTLARVLGKDPVPMLERFEERYASAPVSARTVFEAELSTGMVGSMRRTSGGPNWALLVGAVLALVMVWSLVRLFAGPGEEVLEDPPPMLNGSGGIGLTTRPEPPRPAPAARPVATTLTAVNGGTRVVVRDGQGRVVYRGNLVIGEVQQLEVAPPVTVEAEDGSVLSVTLEGRDLGFLGAAQAPTTRTYQRPAR